MIESVSTDKMYERLVKTGLKGDPLPPQKCTVDTLMVPFFSPFFLSFCEGKQMKMSRISWRISLAHQHQHHPSPAPPAPAAGGGAPTSASSGSQRQAVPIQRSIARPLTAIVAAPRVRVRASGAVPPRPSLAPTCRRGEAARPAAGVMLNGAHAQTGARHRRTHARAGGFWLK